MRYIFFIFVLCASLLADTVYVHLKGNHAVSTDKLLEAYGYDQNGLNKLWHGRISMDGTRDVEDFVKVILEYYRSLGYYKTTVEQKWLDDKDVELYIVEKEPIRIGTIKYVTDAPIQGYVLFKSGDVFTTQKFINTKEAIRRFLNESGYPKAHLDAKAVIDLNSYECTLIYQIDNYVLSYFGAIKIDSNQTVSTQAVKNRLSFKEGDVFDIRKIEKARQAFYNANIFANVTVSPHIHSVGDYIPVDINLTQGKTKSLGGSLGFDTDEKYIVKLFWENRNMFGNMDTLRVNIIKTGVRDYAGADYNILTSAGIATQLLYAESVSYPGYRQNHIQNYPRFTFERGTTGHQIGLKTDMGYVVPGNTSQYIYAENYFLNNPTYKYTLDKRNSKIDATNGYLFGLYSEASTQALGSSIRFFKLVGDGTYTKQLFDDFIVFSRCKIGMIDDYEAGAVPVFERFFAGGVNSNRGYHWRMLGPQDGYGDPIGGQSIIDGSIEGRVLTIKSLWAVAFWDMTQLNYQAMQYNQPFKNSVGLGMRYATPIGPIRIDIGVPLNEQSHYPVLNIAFGQVF